MSCTGDRGVLVTPTCPWVSAQCIEGQIGAVRMAAAPLPPFPSTVPQFPRSTSLGSRAASTPLSPTPLRPIELWCHSGTNPSPCPPPSGAFPAHQVPPPARPHGVRAHGGLCSGAAPAPPGGKLEGTANMSDFWHKLGCCVVEKPQPKKRRRRIDRSMIGEPMNFVHLTHIGSGDMAAGEGLPMPELELPDPHTGGKASLERLIPVAFTGTGCSPRKEGLSGSQFRRTCT
uniref:CRIB domain-containing protein n=1 Tax=Meleagris gallopavo TaxID=9103 RepID=A0A803XKU1_MELGA